MSEAEKQEVVETEAAPEYTEVEQKAMEEGWIPPDRFDSEEQGKEFISAEKYLENGTFFKKINAQKEQIESLQQTVSQINEHNRKVRERELQKMQSEYESKIDALKAEKIAALDEGDSRRVVEIDDEIRRTPVPQIEPTTDNATLKRWKKDNSWYDTDKFLGMEADMMATQLARQQVPLDDALKQIKEHLTIKYPERFENKQRKAAPTVEGGSKKPTPKGAISVKDLDPQEREVFNNWERQGVFKDDAARQAYLKQVVELRD